MREKRSGRPSNDVEAEEPKQEEEEADEKTARIHSERNFQNYWKLGFPSSTLAQIWPPSSSSLVNLNSRKPHYFPAHSLIGRSNSPILGFPRRRNLFVSVFSCTDSSVQVDIIPCIASMVCSIGSGRMTVLARILAAGNLSQNMAEEVGLQKTAGQNICQDLREADEPNLLDEEDMHVFGLRPMSDPLHLVCCNACKKPVKASQFAVHSELCRSLNSSKELQPQVNGAVGCRKPRRKMKKNLLSADTNQAFPREEQQTSDCFDASVDGKHSMPMFSVNGTAYMMNGVSPENEYRQDSIQPTPVKRLKIKSRQQVLPAYHSEAASGLAKTTSTHGKDLKLQPALGSETRNASGFNLKKNEDYQNCSMLQKGLPVPLATKIYYSQRNYWLRSKFAHIYHLTSTSATQTGNNMVHPEFSQETRGKSCSPQRDSLCGLVDGSQKEEELYLHQSSKNLALRSEVCLNKPEVCLPAASNQHPLNNFLTPQMKSKYPATSFVDSSGEPLRTEQRPKGSVHVV